MVSNEIAVVVPVYNAHRYLRRCIKSILAQSFRAFSLVLVDDGSTDRSGIICDKFALKDERVHAIHQDNRGSVEARRTGVLSEWAQSAKYIFISDADDEIDRDALKKLYDVAETNGLDCVCGRTVRMWKGIRIPQSVSQSSSSSIVRIYNNREIIEHLYISCFGISDFPVSLYAKLYKTGLITRAIDFEPIVRFMGDDLSVTLRCLPMTQKLGVITDVVYFYRIGGGTSKFMPYMLEDFLSLYRYKNILLREHPMPQDAEYLIAVELMNVAMTWFQMCIEKGRYSDDELLIEIKRVAGLPEIKQALCILDNRGRQHLISEKLKMGEYGEIREIVIQQLKKSRLKRILKKVLCSI